MNSAETLVTQNVSQAEQLARLEGAIRKYDEESRIVLGFAYLAKRRGGEAVTDHSGDRVDNIALFEKAVYEYVLMSREGDVMHTRKTTSVLVESIFFTLEKWIALGFEKAEAELLPVGWWVGFKILDDEAWDGVKSGKYTMFSIEGVGRYAEAA